MSAHILLIPPTFKKEYFLFLNVTFIFTITKDENVLELLKKLLLQQIVYALR